MVEQCDTEEFAALDADQQLSAGDQRRRGVARAAGADAHLVPHRRLSRPRARVELLRRTARRARRRRVLPRAGLTDAEARRLLLDDTVLPPGLDRRRGARGVPRAQGLDAAAGGLRARRHRDASRTRTSVTEQNFTVELLQPRDRTVHAVFFTHPREYASAYHYERVPAPIRASPTA